MHCLENLWSLTKKQLNTHVTSIKLNCIKMFFLYTCMSASWLYGKESPEKMENLIFRCHEHGKWLKWPITNQWKQHYSSNQQVYNIHCTTSECCSYLMERTEHNSLQKNKRKLFRFGTEVISTRQPPGHCIISISMDGVAVFHKITRRNLKKHENNLDKYWEHSSGLACLTWTCV